MSAFCKTFGASRELLPRGTLNRSWMPTATVPPVNLLYKYYIVVSDEATRIRTAVLQHFLSGVVVIERPAVAGLTTRQVADYGAMQIFASTDPARLKSSTAPSILNVLDAPMGSATPLTFDSVGHGFPQIALRHPGTAVCDPAAQANEEDASQGNRRDR